MLIQLQSAFALVTFSSDHQSSFNRCSQQTLKMLLSANPQGLQREATVVHEKQWAPNLQRKHQHSSRHAAPRLTLSRHRTCRHTTPVDMFFVLLCLQINPNKDDISKHHRQLTFHHAGWFEASRGFRPAGTLVRGVRKSEV